MDTVTGQLLVDINGLASMLSLSRNGAFRFLQLNPDFANSARVALGPRCIRYRVPIVRAFIESMAPVESPQPERLARGIAQAVARRRAEKMPA